MLLLLLNVNVVHDNKYSFLLSLIAIYFCIKQSLNDFENYVNNNKNNNSGSNLTFKSLNNNNIMIMKSNVIKNFNQQNLKQKTPDYDNEYYQKIIEYFIEERARSELTDFNLIYPLKIII